MGAGWKAWKVTTVLWQQKKTLQSTSTTRFSADSINLCVTQFQGISLGGGVSQRCKQRKIKTSSERWKNFHQCQSAISIFHAEKGGSEKAEKVGISAFSHPIRLTEAQVLKRWKCIQEKFKFHRTHHIPTLGERTIVGAAHIRLLSRPAHAYCTYVPAIEVQHTDKYITIISHPEAQKPKTFRIATFYAQKLSGRSARNHLSRQT